MFENAPNLSVNTVAEIVRLAVAPVFLLSGIASFVNVCTARLSRIVDRSRDVEPRLLASRGAEHDRWLAELQVLDRRMSLVSWAISLSVLSAVLICAVVVLLFGASLTRLHEAAPHHPEASRMDHEFAHLEDDSLAQVTPGARYPVDPVPPQQFALGANWREITWINAGF